MIFKYKAIDNRGNIVIGELEAESVEHLSNHMKSRKLVLLDLKKTYKINFFTFEKKIGNKDIATFCRQLELYFQTDIPIFSALDKIMRNTKNTKMKKVIGNLMKGISLGKRLSECMAEQKELPLLFVNMVAIGETSGRFDYIFNRLNSHYEKQSKFLDDIKSAFIYPCIVCVMMLLVIVASMVFVIPRYAEMYTANDISLPGITVALISISNFVVYKWYIMIIVGLIIYIVVPKLRKRRNLKYFFDKVIFHIPVIKDVSLRVVNTRFVEMMSIIVPSGISLIECLHLSSRVIHNDYVRKEIDFIISEIKTGKTFGSSIERSKFLDPVLCSMIITGEATGKFEEVLGKTYIYFERELEFTILKVSKLIEPMITIVIGILVGLIMLAIMLPAFNLSSVL